MASFYEITEDEVELIKKSLALWQTDGKFFTDEDVKIFEDLVYYMEHRERKE